ncbi:MAG: tetratricopeptide repeat protein [Planctomycetota bacterium]|nr:tetratricopeptide repeat protein [Planctomycetota bacterium]
MIRPSALIALLVVIFLFFAAPLAADEGEREDSPAAKAFRDAWWAETGTGALDKAVAAYKQALQAEGSEAIRARAAYRLAVVLHRMGKTEEAVRALESLAKDFPQQAALLAKARQRLDEWTAEDLRTSFREWYQRYQYSPEFQAKIVDLILKLGNRDQKVSEGARQELLTIGEPAIAALTEHTRSPNPTLRNAAIRLMVLIGTLPPPAVLWDAHGWESEDAFWSQLEASVDPVRSAYADAAKDSKDGRAPWITALLQGREAVLEAVARESNDTNTVTRALITPLLLKEQPPAFWTRLKAIAVDEGAHWNIRQWIAGRLINRWSYARHRGEVDPTKLEPADLLAWFDDKMLRKVVLPYMRYGAVESETAWRPIAQAVIATPPGAREQKDLLAALSGQLRRVPAETDLELAVQAFTHVLQAQRLNQLDTWPLTATEGAAGDGRRARDVLAIAISRTDGPIMRSAPKEWWQRLRGRDGVFEALVDWTVNAKDANVRAEAMGIVAGDIDERVQRLAPALATKGRRREMSDALFISLRRNPRLEKLDWDAETLTRLAETAAEWDTSAVGGKRGNIQTSFGRARRIIVSAPFKTYASQVLGLLLMEKRTRDLLFDAAFASPERFPSAIWNLLGSDWAKDEANRAEALSRLRSGWKRWSEAQLGAGVRLFVTYVFLGQPSKEMTALLRELLGAPGIDAETRLHLVEHMDELTLADLRRHYDFEDPEQVDQATAFLDRLPLDEKVFDAFLPALRPDGPKARSVYLRFGSANVLESRKHQLVRKMLAFEGTTYPKRAVAVLERRLGAADLPLWIGMLSHKSPVVRARAAKALGTLYDAAAIKALAKSVDDPDPVVRDAVLKSLERIETIEKQKERWRRFAEGK